MKGINFDIGKSFFREWIFIISMRFRPFHPFSSQRWTFITVIDFHHIDEFLSYIWILIRLINFHHIDDGLFHCTNCIIQMNFHHTNQFSSNWYNSIKKNYINNDTSQSFWLHLIHFNEPSVSTSTPILAELGPAQPQLVSD